jgi:hypothetical protein
MKTTKPPRAGPARPTRPWHALARAVPSTCRSVPPGPLGHPGEAQRLRPWAPIRPPAQTWPPSVGSTTLRPPDAPSAGLLGTTAAPRPSTSCPRAPPPGYSLARTVHAHSRPLGRLRTPRGASPHGPHQGPDTRTSEADRSYYGQAHGRSCGRELQLRAAEYTRPV